MPETDTEPTRHDVVIAGAGIAGFAAAQVLAEAGLRVLVLEKAGVPGGKCMSYRDPQLGHTVEHGIHGVFPRYLNLRKLWSDAGLPASIFSMTKTVGLAGADGRMYTAELAGVSGPTPLFLAGMVPKRVLRLRDFLFASRFLLRCYAGAVDSRELDEGTFGALLTGQGVSKRLKHVLLLPYVRNLTYARADEVSAQVAVEALNYYVLEEADSVKAQWLDGGPSELIFAPWQRRLERLGVTFVFGTPVESVLMREAKFVGFATQAVIAERELGSQPRNWTQELGHHFLGLEWRPEKRLLTALNAVCTHKGCRVALAGEDTSQHYFCPCHGARFDLNGQVLHPPATRPLEPIPLRSDAQSGVWYVEGEGASTAPGGVFAAEFGVIAVDLPGVQHILPKELLLAPSCAGVSLLRTTSVMVLRLCFRTEPGGEKWSGPDSGVFNAEDLLDNFFALHTFQSEFARRDELALECHIGDSERLRGFDDATVYEQTLEVLERYFPAERLRRRFDRERSRLLRHEDVFSLFAPGDLARTPQVSADDRKNLMFAGDWVRSDTPRQRSFFMERAAVTGIEAANAILRQTGRADRLRPLLSPEPPLAARMFGLPVRAAKSVRRALRCLLGLD